MVKLFRGIGPHKWGQAFRFHFSGRLYRSADAFPINYPFVSIFPAVSGLM